MNDRSIVRGAAANVSALLARSSAWVLGGRLLRSAIGVASIAVLARLLSPADFGVLAVAAAVSVLSLSILEGVIDLPIVRNEILTADHVRLLLLTALATLSPFLAVLYITSDYAEAALDFGGLSLALKLTGAVALTQVFWLAGLSILRRQHRFAEAASVTTITGLVYALVSVVLVSIGFGLYGVILGQVCSHLFTGVFLFYRLRIGLCFPKRWDWTIMQQGVGIAPVARLFAWAWTNVDTLMVSLYLGPVATGLYTRAYSLSVQAKEPFLAIDQVLRHAFLARSREHVPIGIHLMGIRLLTLVSALGATILIIFRDDIVSLVLGPQWTASGGVFAVLVAALPARVALMYLDSLSISLGSLKTLLFRQTFLLVLIGTLLFVSIEYGILMVSGIVTLSVYFAILLPAAGEERIWFGSLSSRIQTLLPALGLLLTATALDRAIRSMEAPTFVLYLCQFGLSGAAVAAVICVPSKWLPPNWPEARMRLLVRLSTIGGRIR